jgi:hypothetical protein
MEPFGLWHRLRRRLEQDPCYLIDWLPLVLIVGAALLF